MLGSQDLGRRVVVRRTAGIRDGRPVFRDVIGRLIELTASDLVVARADGHVRIPLAEVHRAKSVPPLARDVESVELAADEAWPAPVTARLGDWRLRAGQGWTGRANAALPVGDPGRPLPEAVDAVIDWYAGHGLNPMINVPLPYAERLDAELAGRGWSHRPLTLVLTADLATVTAATPPVDGLPAPRLTELPSDAWLALAAGRKGGLPAAARHILTAVRRLRFAEVYEDSELIAMARGAVTEGWFGVSLVEVVPSARRRGLARHVIGALARWAREEGAGRAYLQVERRNTAAVTLYERLGYTQHHHYLTRYSPAAPPAAPPVDLGVVLGD